MAAEIRRNPGSRSCRQDRVLAVPVEPAEGHVVAVEYIGAAVVLHSLGEMRFPRLTT